MLNSSSMLVLALLLAGCNKSEAPQQAPAQRAPVVTTGWMIRYSPSTAPGTLDAAGAFSFNFTRTTDGTDYVVKRAPRLLRGQTIKLVFEVAGLGKLMATEGTASPRIKLFMQRAGDTMTATEANKRWWSVAFVDLLGPGVYQLVAKVDPGEWTNVFGKPGTDDPQAFAECVANLAVIGFTFGGQFAGHGVYAVNDDVRFTVRSFEILA